MSAMRCWLGHCNQVRASHLRPGNGLHLDCPRPRSFQPKRRKCLRDCFKIQSGPAARDFGAGQGGEVRASPQWADCLRAAHVNSRQLTGRGLGSQRTEPTPVSGKRPAGGSVGILKQSLKVLDLPDDAQGWQIKTIIRYLLTVPVSVSTHARYETAQICIPAGWLRWWRLFVDRWVPKRSPGRPTVEAVDSA